ncbi:hypothetical protein [Amycolatopsis sp. GA6-003]|uniref:hypothetical protein n=1 Tax=Amycolatopsis sp. GA6-003 TaxID=2652444 RepID=UPI003916E85D
MVREPGHPAVIVHKGPVEDQTWPDDLEATLESIPFPLLAQGLRERAAAGSTDSFGYALGIVLAGLEAKPPR